MKNLKFAVANKFHSAVNTAANSCGEFNIKDETQLIDLIGNVNESKLTKDLPSNSNLHALFSTKHHFVNHLVKSPELRLSPVPIETQVIYDNAAKELLFNQKEKEKQGISGLPNEKCKERNGGINNDGKIKVNVRKQLQQYENLHQQYSKQVQQEQFLQKMCEAAKQRAMKSRKENAISDNINKCPSSVQRPESYKQATIEENKETKYARVPIKNLIINFEHRIQQEEKYNGDVIISNRETRNNINNSTELHHEDLYTPKEIPVSNVCQTFPIRKPYQLGFLTIYDGTQPPKQKYSASDNYQTVLQNVPPVSFNPSPLPYDKLAKFENPSADDVRHNTNIINTSPAPLASSYHKLSEAPNNFPQSASSYVRTTTNPHTNIISNHILNAPTYNSLARSWDCSDNNREYNSHRIQSLPSRRYPNVVNVASVPYTDF